MSQHVTKEQFLDWLAAHDVDVDRVRQVVFPAQTLARPFMEVALLARDEHGKAFIAANGDIAEEVEVRTLRSLP